MVRASVVVCLLLLTLVPMVSRAAEASTDAYFVFEDFTDQAVKGEESASFDYLEVKAVLHVNVSGFYNLSATLEYAKVGLARTSNSSALTAGTHAILLRFRNQDIYMGQAVGNYIIGLSLRTPSFPLEPLEGSYQTHFYHYSDFNPNLTAPYPPGSEFSYVDGARLTIRNNYLTFEFDKNRTSLTYYFTQDGKAGHNGRFTVAYPRVLGYVGIEGMLFQRGQTTHEAVLANGTWKTTFLESGTHRAFGPFVRFNITYTADMVDLRLKAPVSTLDTTFSFYFTGNPHPSADRSLMVMGTTQAELDVTMALTHIIGGSGLVLEQIVQDTTRNHDFLLHDAIGEFRYGRDNVQKTESPFRPLADESVPKLAFINRWEPVVYAQYTWVTAAQSEYLNTSTPMTTGVSYIPEGPDLRLFLAYHLKDPEASFLTVRSTFQFGLEGQVPPPAPPKSPEPVRHDPLLYILGSLLALAIIFASMRYRTRSYMEERRAIEQIEEQELSEPPEGAPQTIEERAIGEEEEWRKRWEKRKKEEGPPPDEDGDRAGDDDTAPPGGQKGKGSGRGGR